MSEHATTPEDLALRIATAKAQRAARAEDIIRAFCRAPGMGLEEATERELIAALLVRLGRLEERCTKMLEDNQRTKPRIILPGAG